MSGPGGDTGLGPDDVARIKAADYEINHHDLVRLVTALEAAWAELEQKSAALSNAQQTYADYTANRERTERAEKRWHTTAHELQAAEAALARVRDLIREARERGGQSEIFIDDLCAALGDGEAGQ